LIGPLEGPFKQTLPHARLFYARHFSPESLWSEWPSLLKSLDETIGSHPRLSLANSGLYLYFFGEEAKEAWVGREIIGHISKAPEGMGVFDSFKTEAFCWKVPNESSLNMTGEDLLKTAYKLRALAGEALADTWRVALTPAEPWTPLGDVHKEMADVTFQFYKKD
jgi:hypothetical protein